MTIARLAGLLAASLLLGACSAKQCRIESNYEPVQPVGPLTNPQGYALPQPDPTYHIPGAGKAAPVPPSASAAGGAEKPFRVSDCLDFPPPLPPEDKPAKPAG